MQANGTGQNRDTELPCRNGAPAAEPSVVGGGHSNGVLSVPAGGNNNGSAAAPVSNNNNNNSPDDGGSGLKKKKRLSPCEEDVIRLIGQHLHELGLKYVSMYYVL